MIELPTRRPRRPEPAPAADLPAGPAIRVHPPAEFAGLLPRLAAYSKGRAEDGPPSYHPAWLLVLAAGLRHAPYCVTAEVGSDLVGFLPLAYVRSLLFGRALVSLPYLNYGGARADDDTIAARLADRAVALADQLDVRFLELRHERALDHTALAPPSSGKVHMRLRLPAGADALWARLPSKVRNQVRKGQKQGLTVAWGGRERLAEFYDVFSRNMRDLGTPVYGAGLFRSVLEQFRDGAELCVVRAGTRPVAAALLLHGRGSTEVPSASSLRRFNHTCANMLLYWSLLERAIGRGQDTFDFGRSSPGGSTFQFKKQWGAEPSPAEWQRYVRAGGATDLRRDDPRYRRMIRLWQRLPVTLTRWIGPAIVRGLP